MNSFIHPSLSQYLLSTKDELFLETGTTESLVKCGVHLHGAYLRPNPLLHASDDRHISTSSHALDWLQNKLNFGTLATALSHLGLRSLHTGGRWTECFCLRVWTWTFNHWLQNQESIAEVQIAVLFCSPLAQGTGATLYAGVSDATMWNGNRW